MVRTSPARSQCSPPWTAAMAAAGDAALVAASSEGDPAFPSRGITFAITPSRCPPAASMIITRDHSVGENVIYVNCYAANLRPGGRISMHGHGSPYAVEGLGALEPGSRQHRLGVDMGITLSTPLTADAAAGLAVNLVESRREFGTCKDYCDVYQHNKAECSGCQARALPP